MKWKIEIFGTLFRNSGFRKIQVFIPQAGKISEFHSVNRKKSSFHFVNGKNFRVPLPNLEKFPGSIP